MSKTAPLIVLFNGPPRAGKDTAAEFARYVFGDQDVYATRIEKFARPVKEGCHGLFGIVDDRGRVVAHDHFEPVKNDPNPEFRGMSPREAYIWYSEEVMKPKFGQDIFGHMAVNNIEHWRHGRAVPPHREKEVVLMSDSGFAVEAKPVIAKYGADNVLLVRIHRDGCTFDGDSRSYIDLGDEVETINIQNPGDDSYEHIVFRVLGKWIESRK